MEHKMSFRFAEWEGSHSETGQNRQGVRLREILWISLREREIDSQLPFFVSHFLNHAATIFSSSSRMPAISFMEKPRR